MAKLSRRGFLQFASLIGAAATMGYQPVRSSAEKAAEGADLILLVYDVSNPITIENL